VVEVLLQPFLDRLQASEVDDPAFVTQQVAVEGELDLQSVAMQVMAVTGGTPLPEAAAKAEGVRVNLRD
jgi:hypothetical protein